MSDQKNKAYIRYGSAKPAVDVDIAYIEDYMCDMGPKYCFKCYSKCAYGERYLKECCSNSHIKHSVKKE